MKEAKQRHKNLQMLSHGGLTIERLMILSLTVGFLNI